MMQELNELPPTSVPNHTISALSTPLLILWAYWSVSLCWLRILRQLVNPNGNRAVADHRTGSMADLRLTVKGYWEAEIIDGRRWAPPLRFLHGTLIALLPGNRWTHDRGAFLLSVTRDGSVYHSSTKLRMIRCWCSLAWYGANMFQVGSREGGQLLCS